MGLKQDFKKLNKEDQFEILCAYIDESVKDEMAPKLNPFLKLKYKFVMLVIKENIKKLIEDTAPDNIDGIKQAHNFLALPNNSPKAFLLWAKLHNNE